MIFDYTNRKPFTWKSAALVTVLLLAVLIFLSLVIAALSAALGGSPEVSPTAAAAVNSVGFLLVFLHASARYGIRLQYRVPAPRPGLVPFVLLTLAGFLIVLSELNNLMNYLLPSLEPMYREMMRMLEEAPLPAVVLLLSIVAPVTEEILFRGVILEGLLERYDDQSAVIVSSLLFGAMHLNPSQFVYGTMLGLFLGYLYLSYRSVLPCILAHGLLNFVPVLLIRILGIDIPGFTSIIEGRAIQQPLWFNLAGVLLLAAGLWGFVRIYRANGPGEPIRPAG